MKKRENIIYLLIIAAGLILYILAMHDRMTAHGVGLYMALRFQKEDRRLFDLGADIVRAAAFLLLLLAPCVLLKCRSMRSFFRIFSAWIGFLPFVNGGVMVHIIFDPMSVMSQDISLADRFWNSAAGIFVVFRSWLPLLLLIALCRHLTGDGEDAARKSVKIPAKILGILLAVQAVMFVLLFAVPGMGELWSFVLLYLLLAESFALWEDLCEKNPRWNRMSVWLFGPFWLRGIYRMLEILSTSNIAG